MSINVTVIQHVLFEDLGAFVPVLQEKAYKLRYLQAGYDDLQQLDPYDKGLWIILGGPIGVNEQEDYPFLDVEVSLLKKRLAADLPTLGICLGAQLMASALGSRIYPGRAKEIGWQALSWVEPDSVLRHLAAEKTEVLHWHGDTFDLPEGAQCLAATEITLHQAFSWRNNGLALQFHPEVTQAGMERWFIGHTGELREQGLSIPDLRKDSAEKTGSLQEQGRQMLLDWLSRVHFS